MKCKYMKSAEFKARQAWLDFVDAIGVALQIMAEVKENSAAWLKKWVKNFRMPTAKPIAPIQEALDLVISTDILKWADWTPAKNYELELKPIEIKKSNIDYDPDPDGYWAKCAKEFRNQKVTVIEEERGWSWMVYIATRKYLKNAVSKDFAEKKAAETRILVKQGGPLNYPS